VQWDEPVQVLQDNGFEYPKILVQVNAVEVSSIVLGRKEVKATDGFSLAIATELFTAASTCHELVSLGAPAEPALC
jgi:hypothetical protein